MVCRGSKRRSKDNDWLIGDCGDILRDHPLSGLAMVLTSEQKLRLGMLLIGLMLIIESYLL